MIMKLKIGNEGDLFLTEFSLYSRARSDKYYGTVRHKIEQRAEI